jgi:hypothetical protein
MGFFNFFMYLHIVHEALNSYKFAWALLLILSGQFLRWKLESVTQTQKVIQGHLGYKG